MIPDYTVLWACMGNMLVDRREEDWLKYSVKAEPEERVVKPSRNCPMPHCTILGTNGVNCV